MSDLQLIDAIKADDSATVKQLIKSNADINQSDEQGWTPLNWAAGRGNIEIVKLLVESGADIFKVGRDQRTAYMIALAAGRVEVARFLREAEKTADGGKLSKPPRKYCKAHYLKTLRQFPGWSESKINWKENTAGKSSDDKPGDDLSEDSIVFIHQDLTVTRSMWHSEDVIFNRVDSEWEEFCTRVLNFKVPDDLDLIVPADSIQAEQEPVLS